MRSGLRVAGGARAANEQQQVQRLALGLDVDARVTQRGGRVAHIDVTVVCEAPRVGPHRDAMRTRIADIAGIAVERVGIKATTSEKMGFTGRGEGIAAMATATVRLPWSW